MPGDVIRLKRGAVFRGELTIPASGSDGNPIVVTAYGSGDPPIILGTDVATGWRAAGSAWMKTMPSMPGIVFEDGSPMRWVRWQGSFAGTGTKLLAGCFSYDPTSKTVFIKPRSGQPTDHVYEVAQRPHGISAFEKDYIIIKGITVHGFARHGIVAENATGWLIYGNTIRFGGGFWESQNEYLGNGIEFSADCHDCIARDNRIEDVFDSGLTTQTYPSGAGSPSGILFEKNQIRRCGLAGIEIALYEQGDRLTKCTVRGNLVEGTGRGWSGLGDGTTGGHAIYVYAMSETPLTAMSGVLIDRTEIIDSAGDGVYILNNCGRVRVTNNLIASNGGRGVYFKLYEDTGGGLDAVGNTICRNKQSGVHFESYYGSLRLASNSVYRNGSQSDGRNGGRGTHNVYIHEYVRSGIILNSNIFHAVESAAIWMSDDQRYGSQAKYNCYYRSNGPVAVCAGQQYTAATFRGALGDAISSMAADPRYRNAEVDDCALQPESPCVGAGPSGVDMGAQVLWA
jgi:hypothetical protein